MKIVVAIALISLFLCVSLAQSNSDQITNLPGLGNISFKQYSGYIEVAKGRFLFYWFVESQRDPATDKLVLWLNGGPGCSSIGGGLMTENGPFRVQPDGSTIKLNPNSWNTVANVIYLESPAGVGFSYSNNASDYNVGDRRTADDAYNFLQGFFNKYPQYRNSPFWITGESYGGHYVPTLAKRIMDGNADSSNPKINLEGIMAGNAWTYMPIDNYGAVFYWYTHALISDETFAGLSNTCNFTDIGPLSLSKNKREVMAGTCNDYINLANKEMGNINIYDIYVDVCESSSQKIIKQMARAGSKIHRIMDVNPPYLPCADDYTGTYMNKPEVKAAIHANIPYPWAECSSIVNYNYSDVEASVIPLYGEFIKAGLEILVYSGDVDAIVPVTGTRAWLATLGLKIKESWAPYTVNKQVGGYTVVYDGLTFATVRNAGHMVPQTQPERALYMFENFLYKGRL